ncbi:glycine oxidase ThiO [Calothrix sp. NIES-4071]|nr:glycine oxidase ThiO [Calothrix sp. NIES-4071]BAZ55117.1 glycine oxidase ThiO [Calothrix sp. NIES-4105]
MNTVYDVIIIGGGIAGASLAYHLVCQGVKTLLFDRRDEGLATHAGAGIVSPFTASNAIGFGNDSLFNFAVEALEYYPILMKQLDKQSDSSIFANNGLIVVAAESDDFQKFEELKSCIYQRYLARSLSTTNEVRSLSSDEAQQMFPALAKTKGAIYVSRAAQVDGSLITQALYTAAEQHNLTVKPVGVEQLIIQNHVVKGVVANGDTFLAQNVAIAGGAWSIEFEKQLGLKIPITPLRGQIIHLNVTNIDTTNKPIISTVGDRYMMSWPDNRVVVGASRESVGFDVHTTVEGVHEVLGEALRVTPKLKDASLREIRVGLRPISQDQLPILGTVPNIDNLYLATGLGNAGLSAGPYIGKVVAETILNKHSQTDITAFNVQRFN